MSEAAAVIMRAEKAKRRPSVITANGNEKSMNEDRELFLWKFPDVSRPEINELLNDFKRFGCLKLQLDIHESCMLLEHRGNTQTATELRATVAEMDKNNDGMLSFLELACALYKKSWESLNDFVDEAARAQAIQMAMEAGEAARRAEEAILEAKMRQEEEARRRAEELERESKLTGVAGAAAFFSRKMEGAQDSTMSNAEKIKADAARRKALREAKKQLEEAEAAKNAQMNAEMMAEQIRLAAEKVAQEEAAIQLAKEEEARQARAARKAALNAKWSGSSVPAPK